MTRGLPYEIFMRQIIFELEVSGQLNQLRKKWEIPKPNCGALYRTGNSLSWQKLFSISIIVVMGISIAFAILFIEKIYHYICQQNINPTNCLIKDVNRIKLQHLLTKIDSNLKNDITIKYSTMRALYQEMENYNSLLDDAKRQVF